MHFPHLPPKTKPQFHSDVVVVFEKFHPDAVNCRKDLEIC